MRKCRCSTNGCLRRERVVRRERGRGARPSRRPRLAPSRARPWPPPAPRAASSAAQVARRAGRATTWCAAGCASPRALRRWSAWRAARFIQNAEKPITTDTSTAVRPWLSSQQSSPNGHQPRTLGSWRTRASPQLSDAQVRVQRKMSVHAPCPMPNAPCDNASLTHAVSGPGATAQRLWPLGPHELQRPFVAAARFLVAFEVEQHQRLVIPDPGIVGAYLERLFVYLERLLRLPHGVQQQCFARKVTHEFLLARRMRECPLVRFQRLFQHPALFIQQRLRVRQPWMIGWRLPEQHQRLVRAAQPWSIAPGCQQLHANDQRIRLRKLGLLSQRHVE